MMGDGGGYHGLYIVYNLCDGATVMVEPVKCRGDNGRKTAQSEACPSSTHDSPVKHGVTSSRPASIRSTALPDPQDSTAGVARVGRGRTTAATRFVILNGAQVVHLDAAAIQQLGSEHPPTPLH